MSGVRAVRVLVGSWPRVGEFVLAAWLALYASVFPDGVPAFLLLHDVGLSVAVAASSVISMLARRGPLRFLHTTNIALGGWLVTFSALVTQHHSMALAQNDILVGLTVVMFAILPTRALDAPVAWQRYYRTHPAKPSPAPRREVT